jgi:hypothetical protein
MVGSLQDGVARAAGAFGVESRRMGADYRRSPYESNGGRGSWLKRPELHIFASACRSRLLQPDPVTKSFPVAHCIAAGRKREKSDEEFLAESVYRSERHA